ncbi:ABC-type transport auxiliary lipoprotein family protein [Massilia sp. PAMC28688]|uniref:ABC-type transport auxiliary lipoprotein family protein n=1 Tax=Massilia sp. PAMC28688 TaxID=2861283 RepID=UPI001E2BA31E|nr:ABC-type transport auxiliary lipoprotein family protein [Massilia sp. PAMC28688]
MHSSLTPFLPRAAALGALLAAVLLAGCATEKAPRNASYDFGPATTAAAPAPASIDAVVVTDVTGSAAFDSERMYYRLNYADPLQSRVYSNSRWAATPLQLVTQRLKTRFGQSGAKVLTPTDASAGIKILRLEMDDFNHSFDSVAQSYGQVTLRASLFQQHKLVDQKIFSRKISATTADAAGGARALTAATDAIAADMVAWLASLPTAQVVPKQ